MKKLLAALLAFAMLIIPAAALAEGEDDIIANADFSDWQYGTPDGWTFYSPTGSLSENGEGAPVITLEEQDFALLTQQITLKSETCYRITCPVNAEGVEAGENIGANINFEYQGAYSELEDGVLSIYVRTNVAEEQDYMLRIGIGDEYSPASGTLILGDMTVEELSVIPEDVPVYTLIGEIGIYGYGDEEYAPQSEAQSEDELPSYNDIGMLLFCLCVVLALYLLVTGLNGRRLGDLLGSRMTICALFIFAFLLRLFIAVKSGGLRSDVSCFTGWASMTQEYGLNGFYESGLFADYPPAYMYVLWVLGGIAKLFGIAYDSAAFLLLIKLPAIVCDVLIACLIFRLGVKKLGRGASSLMSLFVLLSPMVIVVSCAWAQIDSVFTLAILGVLLLLYRKKTVAASGVWMLALLIKPQALLVAPVIAIVLISELFRKDTRRRTLIDIALCIPVMLAVYAVVSLPMKGSQDFFYVFSRMLETTGQYDYGSVNAFNLMALAGGNFVDSGEPFLFGSYKTMGWLLIALSTALAAFLYCRKNDRKYLFLTTGIYLTCIFMFSHSMHERYIYPAVIILLFAAVLHDSRRLLSAAAALSAAAFVNIYAVLAFDEVGTTFLPYVVVLIGSLVFLAAFICAAVCWARFYADKADKPISYEFNELPPLKERHMAAAAERLNETPDERRRMSKKDVLIMLVITAVYAVVAFTNLGSLNIPEQAKLLSHVGDSVIIELEDVSQAERLSYYAGYCEGSFEVSCAVEEGGEFFPVGETVEHEYSDMFRWQTVDIGFPAKYVKITLISGDMEFREIGIRDESGAFLTTADAQYILADGNRADAAEVIDEYDELPHDGTSYMTEMYFDEVYHARTAYEYIHGIYPYEITHPPLGKAFIALGCMIFGFNPFGWRCMGALAGVLMLPVMYIFVKRIFKSTKWAAFATALFSVEFMHYVQTRIATIDSFSVLFIMLMYLCMYEYSQHSLLKEKLSKTLLPLGMCGLFFALGAATKWICLYAAPGLCILFFYTVFQRAKEKRLCMESGREDLCAGYSKKLALTIIFCVGVFIILPIAVYILSYYPYYNATGGSFGLADVWKNQTYMLNYHGNLSGDPHPYQSSVYTWPFVIRPVYFFLGDDLPANMRAVIWCLGHPLIYVGGMACCIGLIGRRGEAKRGFKGMPFILIALAWQLLPWVVITREVFHYHFFASVPFLIILITYFMRYLCDRFGKKGKLIAIIFLAASALLFILFYPPLTGVPMSVWWARLVKWSPLWPVSV